MHDFIYVNYQKLFSGDIAWMMMASLLVLFMTIPGLSLFYGGMVRKKNVIATLMKSFSVCGIITLAWFSFGYSLAFSNGNLWIGNFDHIFLHGILFIPDSHNLIAVSTVAPKIPELLFFLFQLTFAVITPAIICGGFAERMKFSATIAFCIIWLFLVYVPIAHMMWNPTGWMYKAGVLDYAGGTVVHINSGIAGLVAALVVGKRIGYKKNENGFTPYNLTFSIIGAAMLWIGWFGFNGGSAFAANSIAILSIVNTQIAAAAGLVAWMITEWLVQKKPSSVGIVSGAIAGLVGITPAAGFVTPTSALIIGLVTGPICYWATTHAKNWFGYDDTLDAFGIHGIGGIVGAIATGIFATKDIAGADGNVLIQLKSILFVIVYTTIMTYLILKVIDKIIGLRVNQETEERGLDITQHGNSLG